MFKKNINACITYMYNVHYMYVYMDMYVHFLHAIPHPNFHIREAEHRESFLHNHKVLMVIDGGHTSAVTLESDGRETRS